MRKGYALYSKDVSPVDKYRVTTLPKFQFTTRKKAQDYIRKHNIDVKILTVSGLPVPFK